MFFAKNKITGEKLNSLYVFKNSSYLLPENDKWIADTDEISNWDDIKDIYSEIPVVYVKEKEFTKQNGTPVWTRSHFRIINKNKLGINIVPESKEHKIAKNWIFNKIKNDDIILYVTTFGKEQHLVKPVKLSELLIDFNKIDYETPITDGHNKQIVDIYVPFTETHTIFGNGIVFEIQLSKQKDSTTERRTYDYALKTFSVAWLFKDDFEKINEEFIELKNKEIKVYTYIQLLNDLNIKIQNDTQNYSRQIDGKLTEFWHITNLNFDFIKNEISKREDGVNENILMLKNKIIKEIEILLKNESKEYITKNFNIKFKETKEELYEQLKIPIPILTELINKRLNEIININEINKSISECAEKMISSPDFQKDTIEKTIENKIQIIKEEIIKQITNIIKSQINMEVSKLISKEEINKLISEKIKNEVIYLELFGKKCPECGTGIIKIKKGKLKCTNDKLCGLEIEI